MNEVKRRVSNCVDNVGPVSERYRFKVLFLINLFDGLDICGERGPR